MCFISVIISGSKDVQILRHVSKALQNYPKKKKMIEVSLVIREASQLSSLVEHSCKFYFSLCHTGCVGTENMYHLMGSFTPLS